MQKLFITLFILYAVSANASLPDQAKWEFEVVLDGEKIGFHNFSVNADDGIQTVTTEAKFDVKLFFVNVYSYKHQNKEVWEDNCLAAIEAETDANGKDYEVRGKSNNGQFQMQSRTAEKDLPSCIMTYAYWNPDFLTADRLLNSQTGNFESVDITRVGEDVLTFNGQEIKAIKYSLSAEAGPITLWYAANDYRWLGLESTVRGGRVLRYEPISLPAASKT